MLLFGIISAMQVGAPDSLASPNSRQSTMNKLDGEWVYVEDRTEGRSLEQLGPPMSARFSFRTEEGAVVLVSGHGSGHRDVRVRLDGEATDVKSAESTTLTRYTGAWKDGVFSYETEYFRGASGNSDGKIRKEFRPTDEGLVVRVITDPSSGSESIGLYRHPEDIPMPTPAKATIQGLKWLEGAWVGSRGTGGAISMEERWTPAKGGAMLGVSRTVSRDKMSAFEFLRIYERDGGLVYAAQPNGTPATEFILTELADGKAVFDNPRHDYPKRITYELGPDGGLRATIGFMRGGTPRNFDYRKEETAGE